MKAKFLLTIFLISVLFGGFLYYLLHREKVTDNLDVTFPPKEEMYINPVILDNLQSTNPEIRIDALDYMYTYYTYTYNTHTYENRRIREILESSLLDHDPTVVSAASQKLSLIGDEEVIKDLQNLLENNRDLNNEYEDKVRLAVLLALSDINKEAAVDVIIEELRKSEDIYHAQDVLYVLAKMQSPKSLEALFDHLQLLKSKRPPEDNEDLNELWDQQISDIEVIIAAIKNKKPLK